MSRGPLEVLREYACQHGNPEDFDEAIAQVEALVEAASAGSAMRTAGHGDSLYFGASAGHADRLREALAPFTPGQDSEGGGNG